MKQRLSDILKTLYRKRRSLNPRIFLTMRIVQCYEKFMTMLFNYPSRCYEVEDRPPLTFSNPSREIKYFSDRFGIYSIKRSLLGRVSKEKEDFDLVCRILEKVDEKITNEKLYTLLTAEIICKALAYRNISEGDTVPVPTIEGDYRGIVKYHVESIFALWKDVVAFGLIPEGEIGKPILLYRGTEFNIATKTGRATMLSDLDPEGPGHKMFTAARETIQKWLHGPGKSEVIVMGHSLGGALANYTAIYEHDAVSCTAKSYTFNAPGIDLPVVATWEAIPEEKRPNIAAYISRGDVVAKFGKLYNKAYEIYNHQRFSPVIAHQTLLFAQPYCYFHSIDIARENHSTSRRYYSKLQKHTTSWAYKFGLKHLLPKPNR